MVDKKRLNLGKPKYISRAITKEAYGFQRPTSKSVKLFKNY